MPEFASPAARQRRLLLLGRLQDAEDAYGAQVRSERAGVRTAALDSDLKRWCALGAAIVELALAVRRHCSASGFCDARPRLDALAARLVESIDDQIDAAAWRVIEAQVYLTMESLP